MDTEDQAILEHVILAHTRGALFNLIDEIILKRHSLQVPTEHR